MAKIEITFNVTIEKQDESRENCHVDDLLVVYMGSQRLTTHRLGDYACVTDFLKKKAEIDGA